ncbi:MAG: extracellular solute-binding protein [Azospirillaceae bacterium]
MIAAPAASHRPTMRILRLLAFAAALAIVSPAGAPAQIVEEPFFSEFDTPDLAPGFDHLPYAAPEAPQGGTITLSAFNSFDSLNFVPIGGEYPRSLGLLYDSLLVESQDQVGVFYPRLAETVRYPQDLAWVEFVLHPDARWNDGEPVTAGDVVWSYEAVVEMDLARPFLQAAYEEVSRAQVVDDRTARFEFDGGGTRSAIAQLAGMTILPRHWWTTAGRDLAESTLEPPLGSGPYRLVDVDAGRSLTYERVADYWGRDLPVNRGLWNFERVVYDFYRDRTIMFEAFLGGAYDFQVELSSRNWGIGYDTPAVADGRLQRLELPAISYRGMQGFFFNTRQPQFADIRVREALNYLYPFEFVRQNVMYGLRDRITSYFLGSDDYSQSGVPEGRELEILEEYRGQVPDWIFDQPIVLPDSANADRPGVPRANRRIALDLLVDAGWTLDGAGRLVDAEGVQMSAEILLSSSVLEPHTAPFIEEMRAIGIDAGIRIVDSAQYQRRYEDRAFEIISFAYSFYPPPGSFERNRFHSEAADENGSANIIGVADPVVDDLLTRIVAANDITEKQALTRALDRVLMAGWYVVPHWHSDEVWIAHWDRFGFPERQPRLDIGRVNSIGYQETWWIDPDRDRALEQAGR